jgi:hypothetical protein
MGELEKLSHALGDLADVVDLDKLVDRLSSIDAEDVVDPDEVFRALAHALSGAAEWLGDIAGSARETGARVAGGSARWVSRSARVPLSTPRRETLRRSLGRCASTPPRHPTWSWEAE